MVIDTQTQQFSRLNLVLGGWTKSWGSVLPTQLTSSIEGIIKMSYVANVCLKGQMCSLSGRCVSCVVNVCHIWQMSGNVCHMWKMCVLCGKCVPFVANVCPVRQCVSWRCQYSQYKVPFHKLLNGWDSIVMILYSSRLLY